MWWRRKYLFRNKQVRRYWRRKHPVSSRLWPIAFAVIGIVLGFIMLIVAALVVTLTLVPIAEWAYQTWPDWRVHNFISIMLTLSWLGVFSVFLTLVIWGCLLLNEHILAKMLRRQAWVVPFLCWHCGYNLSGNLGDCPECGHRRAETIDELKR